MARMQTAPIKQNMMRANNVHNGKDANNIKTKHDVHWQGMQNTYCESKHDESKQAMHL